MSKTQANLRQAFAGESMARNKYTFFAEIAAQEGYEQIAAIFRETADNEREHAKRLMYYMEGEDKVPGGHAVEKWGNTEKNLAMGIAGEHYEWTAMYKQFEKEAQKEGFDEIARQFKEIAEAEEKHEERYQQILKNLQQGQTFESEKETEWKCRNCGYVHKGTKPPEKCPACRKPRAWFERRATNY